MGDRLIPRVEPENPEHERVQTSPFPPKPAVSEQVAALERQLDEALVDRDAAQDERDRLLSQVDELQRQIKLARQVEADLGRELSEARQGGKDYAQSYFDAILAERDKAYRGRDAALAEFDRVVGELGRWKGSHYRMANDLKKALRERDDALAERDEARELVANCKTRMQDLEQRAEVAERDANKLRKVVQDARAIMVDRLNTLIREIDRGEVL